MIEAKHPSLMTFSTATIQGYVTAKKSTFTPQKRNVVNMLVFVPDKRELGNKKSGEYSKGDVYKVSVWDAQALKAAEFIKPEGKDSAFRQIVTFSGSLKMDEYSVNNPNSRGEYKPMMRLDFATILDYGKPIAKEQTLNSTP